jgi:hypothetical protein
MYQKARKYPFLKRWPIVIVAFGVVLTLFWIAVLTWLPFRIVGV